MSGHAPAPLPTAPNPPGGSRMQTAGCPAVLGACVSSSFFTDSIGGQAGQSHFFRVQQVICKEQTEVKGDLNGKPFMQKAM